MPGLIDTHVHLAGGDFEPNREADPVGLAAFRMVPPAVRTLQAGFTTIRVAGSRDFLDVDLRDAIAEGAVVGPRILASGRGLTTTGGHYHNWCAVEVDGVDAVRREVRNHVKRGVDSIKLMLSPGIATEGSNVNTEQFALDEVQAAVYEAHKVGKSVLSHAIGIGGIRNGVEAGVDSIDHGFYLDEEQAHKMKAKGIYLVPTFGPTHYYVQKRQAEAVADQAGRAGRADPRRRLQAGAGRRRANRAGLRLRRPVTDAERRERAGDRADGPSRDGADGGDPGRHPRGCAADQDPGPSRHAGAGQGGRPDRGGGQPRGRRHAAADGITMVVQAGQVRRDDLGLAAR